MDRRKKAIILNDTRRTKGHLGCKMVMKNIESLCKQNNIDILASFRFINLGLEKSTSKLLVDTDIIIINGEGTMHDDAPYSMHLLRVAKVAKELGKKCYLINSVWQNNSNKSIRYLKYFDGIFVRESHSMEELKAAGAKALVVPDLSFYGPVKKKEKTAEAKNTYKILFTDSVIWSRTKFLAELAVLHNAPFRLMSYDNHLKLRFIKLLTVLVYKFKLPLILSSESQLTNKDLVVTGRFHAMCLSIRHKVPFVAFSSNTHKIESVLLDIGLPLNKYLISHDASKQQVSQHLVEFKQLNEEKAMIEKYLINAQKKIQKMFHKISR